jgi:hypothetical protein
MKNHRILFRCIFFAVSLLPPSRLCAGEPSSTETASFPHAPRKGVHLDEIGFCTGYARGKLQHSGEEYVAVPAGLRLGFDMRPLFGMARSSVAVQLAVEPFVDAVTRPRSGVEAGTDIFIRAFFPVAPSVGLVPEIGSGLVYLGLDTGEQGDAGINFLTQFGLGARVALGNDSALTVGYRFRHLSNAGLRQPNDGINTDALVISYSLLR